jgi:hypothetical protein
MVIDFQNAEQLKQLREATERTARLAHQRGNSGPVTQHSQDVIDDCKLMLGALNEIERLRMELETCRIRLGGHPSDPTHWPVSYDPMTGIAG